MPLPMDHVLVALFAVMWPSYEAFVGYPRFKRRLASGAPGVRMRAYAQAIAIQWTLATLAVVTWLRPGRPAAGIGLSAPAGAGFWIGAALVAALTGFLVVQHRALAANRAALGRVRATLAPAIPLLPHTSEELRGFVALSVTAGVCEEILYRGFLMTWLAAFIGFPGAVFASSAVFGIAHGYLDRVSAVKAGVAGLAMAGLYALTHSLWLPMAAHAFIDVNSGMLAHLALQADRGEPRAA